MVALGRLNVFLRQCALGVLFVLLPPSNLVAGQLEDIEVSITTHLGDRQSFVGGDVISFLLTLDSDAYIYLFYEDADANILLIYPNQQSASHLYKKGFFMPLPPLEQNFQFKIQAPFGEEALFVFASDNARISLPGRKLKNGLSLIESSISEIETSIRRQSIDRFGLSVLNLISRAD